METFRSRLGETGSGLRAHGALFWSQTKDAGFAFVNETREATRSFGTRAVEASEALAESHREARQELLDAFRTEQELWQDFLGEQAARWRATALLLRAPAEAQRRFLGAARVTLDKAGNAIDKQLAELETRQAERLSVGAAEPFRGYGEASAKAILAKLTNLGKTDLEAILSFENAHKKRATVIKAVRDRLAPHAEAP